MQDTVGEQNVPTCHISPLNWTEQDSRFSYFYATWISPGTNCTFCGTRRKKYGSVWQTGCTERLHKVSAAVSTAEPSSLSVNSPLLFCAGGRGVGQEEGRGRRGNGHQEGQEICHQWWRGGWRGWWINHLFFIIPLYYQCSAHMAYKQPYFVL